MPWNSSVLTFAIGCAIILTIGRFEGNVGVECFVYGTFFGGIAAAFMFYEAGVLAAEEEDEGSNDQAPD